MQDTGLLQETMLAAEVEIVVDPVSLAGRKYFDNSEKFQK